MNMSLLRRDICQAPFRGHDDDQRACTTMFGGLADLDFDILHCEQFSAIVSQRSVNA